MVISKYGFTQPNYSPDDGGSDGGGGAAQLDSLLNSMAGQGDNGTDDAGGGDGDPGDGGDGDPGDGDPGTGDGAGDPNQNTDPNDPNANKDPKPGDAANAAFAQMRVQNKELLGANQQMTQVIQAMAKSMGVEGNSMNEIMEKLNDDAINKAAGGNEQVAALMKEVNQLKQRDQIYTQAQLKTAADDGFRGIQKEFGLSNEELIRFAGELDAQQLNPYAVQGVNIREKFVAANLTTIIDRQVQAALQRAAKGENHSSTPSDKSGGTGDTKKISSVAGLTAMLNDVNL